MNSFIKFLVVGTIVCTSFVASAQQFPTVSTGDASDRQANSAVLNGSVVLTNEVPFGQFYFQYGRTTNYGSQSPRRSASENRTFSQAISGLNEETGYNFRAVLIASDGTSYFGANKSFVTPSELEDPGDIPGPFEPNPPTGSTSGTGNTSGTGGAGTGTPQPVDPECELPSGDCDGDTIPNDVECGTVWPCTRDTDGDGIANDKDPRSYDPELDDNQVPNIVQTLQAQNSSEGGGFTANGGFSSSGGLTASGGIESVGGFNFNTGGSAPARAPVDTNIEGAVNGGLIPCGNTAGDPCTFNHVIIVIQNIINFIVVFSIFIGVALIVYGGFLYLQDGGKSSNVSKAKGIFMNVAIGYFFVLTAWLIVNFIVSPKSEGGSGLIRDEFQAQLEGGGAANNLDLLNDN